MNDVLHVRIDKWLWAARFFKSRSLAAAAVDSRRVKCNGESVKPARELKLGDQLDITAGESRFVVIVHKLAEQRRPSPEARLLYAEIPESIARRTAQQELRKLAPVPGSDIKGRPTKRDGRLIRGLG